MWAGSLTDYTGKRRNAERYTVVLTMEVNRHTALVALTSGIVTFIISAAFIPLLGVYTLLFLPIGIITGNVLFLGRKRRGLKVRMYQRILNLRKSANGVPFIRGLPMSKPSPILHQPVVVDDHTFDPRKELQTSVGLD